MPGRHSAFSRPGRWAPETKALAGTLPGLQDNYKRQPRQPELRLTCTRGAASECAPGKGHLLTHH